MSGKCLVSCFLVSVRNWYEFFKYFIEFIKRGLGRPQPFVGNFKIPISVLLQVYSDFQISSWVVLPLQDVVMWFLDMHLFTALLISM
jgi:hypothetical protein